MFSRIRNMVWGKMWGKEFGRLMGNLTAIQVRNLKSPGRYSDGNGLLLDIGKSGRGSWVVRVQSSGRRRDIGIGSLSALTLGEARDAAAQIRREVRAGIDVVTKRRQEREVIPSFRDAALKVHAEHKAAWKNGKHQLQWINTLQTYVFPTLGDRLVSEIEGPAIRDVLAPIWLAKPETARRVRQRIGSVLDWSYAKGFRVTEAPMRSLARGLPRQPKRDRHFEAMPFGDVPAFLASLRERSSVGRLALEFLILTATRSGEVRGCSWSEIDLDRRLWTIAAERMKAGKVHVVPLNDAALATLERAKLYRAPASDLVFPGQNIRRSLSDMTLLKILRDMDLGLTVHGFRSSFRDWAAEETNYPGEIAEAALAHAITNKVEAAYRRTDFLEKRKSMMADWGDYCGSGSHPSAA
jgi:integrase